MPPVTSTPLFRIAVLLSGRGSNFAAIAGQIRKHALPIEIAVALSDQHGAKGLELARQLDIPTVVVPRRPKELSNEEFNREIIGALQPFHPQLLVLAGFMRIVHPCLIDAFAGQVVNIHPALLPSFKGLDAQRQALEAGVRFAGCTVHFVTRDVDSGPIIAQAVVPVLPGDTEETLSQRILEREHQVFPAVVAAIASGAVKLVDGNRVEWQAEALPRPTADALLSIPALDN